MSKYRIELEAAIHGLPLYCAFCEAWFDSDGIEIRLFKGYEHIGNICRKCLKKGPGHFSSTLRDQANRLRARANALKALAERKIKVPTSEEWDRAKKKQAELNKQKFGELEFDGDPNFEVPGFEEKDGNEIEGNLFYSREEEELFNKYYDQCDSRLKIVKEEDSPHD